MPFFPSQLEDPPEAKIPPMRRREEGGGPVPSAVPRTAALRSRGRLVRQFLEVTRPGLSDGVGSGPRTAPPSRYMSGRGERSLKLVNLGRGDTYHRMTLQYTIGPFHVPPVMRFSEHIYHSVYLYALLPPPGPECDALSVSPRIDW